MPRSVPKRHPLDQSKLYSIQSRAKLAALFGLTRTSLGAIVVMDRPYTSWPLRGERNGKVKIRIIQQPRGGRREIHAYVSRALSRIAPPDFLFCPVIRRSYVSNAVQHAGAKEIRTLDVKAYFASTPSNRVYWFFHTIMRCSSDVSAVLAKLLTAENDAGEAFLATGSPVSPILSFFAFYDMWLAIAKIAKEANCVLTVYMDDITLSGDAVPERVVWLVRKQIHARGLHYHKERRFTGHTAEITGTIIKGGKLQVPNRQLKKAYDTRTALEVTIDPEIVATLRARLRGLHDQRRQVEGI